MGKIKHAVSPTFEFVVLKSKIFETLTCVITALLKLRVFLYDTGQIRGFALVHRAAAPHQKQLQFSVVTKNCVPSFLLIMKSTHAS